MHSKETGLEDQATLGLWTTPVHLSLGSGLYLTDLPYITLYANPIPVFIASQLKLIYTLFLS
mgnify:CR=1 FL=1